MTKKDKKFISFSQAIHRTLVPRAGDLFVIPVCDTSTSKSAHRESVISSTGKFKPWLRDGSNSSIESVNTKRPEWLEAVNIL